MTITSVKGLLKIVLLAHIQLQFNNFNIYNSFRLYEKLRSIPMSDVVAHFRKPKKWNRMKGCIIYQNINAFRSAEISKKFLDYRKIKIVFNTARVN
jgi:hypothetical protein